MKKFISIVLALCLVLGAGSDLAFAFSQENHFTEVSDLDELWDAIYEYDMDVNEFDDAHQDDPDAWIGFVPEFRLTRDMSIPQGTDLDTLGTIIVPAGVTLTVEKDAILTAGILIEAGGTVLVKSGGLLRTTMGGETAIVNRGALTVEQGAVLFSTFGGHVNNQGDGVFTMNGTYYIHGYYDAEHDNEILWFDNNGATVSGTGTVYAADAVDLDHSPAKVVIAKERFAGSGITVMEAGDHSFSVSTLAELWAAIDQYQSECDSYRNAHEDDDTWIGYVSDFVLSADLVIPGGVELSTLGNIVVPEGRSLTFETGSIANIGLENHGNVTVRAGADLSTTQGGENAIANYGTLIVDQDGVLRTIMGGHVNNKSGGILNINGELYVNGFHNNGQDQDTIWFENAGTVAGSGAIFIMDGMQSGRMEQFLAIAKARLGESTVVIRTKSLTFVETLQQLKDAIDQLKQDEAAFEAVNPDAEIGIRGQFALSEDLTIPDGEQIMTRGTIGVPDGVTLTIESGAELTAAISVQRGGTVIVKNGGKLNTTMAGIKAIDNLGEMIIEEGGELHTGMGGHVFNETGGNIEVNGSFFIVGFHNNEFNVDAVWFFNYGEIYGEGDVFIDDMTDGEHIDAFKDLVTERLGGSYYMLKTTVNVASVEDVLKAFKNSDLGEDNPGQTGDPGVTAVLTADITMPKDAYLGTLGKIVIPQGITLTLDEGAYLEACFEIQTGGTLIVEEGACAATTMGDREGFVNSGMVYVRSGGTILSQMGGYIINKEGAKIFVKPGGGIILAGYQDDEGEAHLWFENYGILYNDNDGGDENALLIINQAAGREDMDIDPTGLTKKATEWGLLDPQFTFDVYSVASSAGAIAALNAMEEARGILVNDNYGDPLVRLDQDLTLVKPLAINGGVDLVIENGKTLNVPDPSNLLFVEGGRVVVEAAGAASEDAPAGGTLVIGGTKLISGTDEDAWVRPVDDIIWVTENKGGNVSYPAPAKEVHVGCKAAASGNGGNYYLVVDRDAELVITGNMYAGTIRCYGSITVEDGVSAAVDWMEWYYGSTGCRGDLTADENFYELLIVPCSKYPDEYRLLNWNNFCFEDRNVAYAPEREGHEFTGWSFETSFPDIDEAEFENIQIVEKNGKHVIQCSGLAEGHGAFPLALLGTWDDDGQPEKIDEHTYKVYSDSELEAAINEWSTDFEAYTEAHDGQWPDWHVEFIIGQTFDIEEGKDLSTLGTITIPEDTELRIDNGASLVARVINHGLLVIRAGGYYGTTQGADTYNFGEFRVEEGGIIESQMGSNIINGPEASLDLDGLFIAGSVKAGPGQTLWFENEGEIHGSTGKVLIPRVQVFGTEGFVPDTLDDRIEATRQMAEQLGDTATRIYTTALDYDEWKTLNENNTVKGVCIAPDVEFNEQGEMDKVQITVTDPQFISNKDLWIETNVDVVIASGATLEIDHEEQVIFGRRGRIVVEAAGAAGENAPAGGTLLWEGTKLLSGTDAGAVIKPTSNISWVSSVSFLPDPFYPAPAQWLYVFGNADAKGAVPDSLALIIDVELNVTGALSAGSVEVRGPVTMQDGASFTADGVYWYNTGSVTGGDIVRQGDTYDVLFDQNRGMGEEDLWNMPFVDEDGNIYFEDNIETFTPEWEGHEFTRWEFLSGWEEVTEEQLESIVLTSKDVDGETKHGFAEPKAFPLIVRAVWDGGEEPPADDNRGDVNGNDDISADDLTLLSRYVANIEPVPQDQAVFKACDVDGNGEVDANDLTLLSRLVAGIISELPAPINQ